MKKENNALKIKLINITKKNVLFRKLARKVIYTKRLLGFKLRTLGIKIDEKTAIFFAFKGKSYACSPRAIYEYMLTDEKYKDFKFIWAFEEPEKHQDLNKNRNTRVVKYGAKEYDKCLAGAKYWIFNYRVPEHLYPKKIKFMYNVGMEHHLKN